MPGEAHPLPSEAGSPVHHEALATWPENTGSIELSLIAAKAKVRHEHHSNMKFAADIPLDPEAEIFPLPAAVHNAPNVSDTN